MHSQQERGFSRRLKNFFPSRFFWRPDIELREFLNNYFDGRASKKRYTKGHDVSDQIIFLGRFGLMLTLLILPIMSWLSSSYSTEVHVIHASSHLFIVLPFLLLANVVSRMGGSWALFWGNAVAYLGMMMAWAYSIEKGNGHVIETNYYMYLPIMSLIYVQNLVLFSLRPLASFISGFVLFLFIILYPIFRDVSSYADQKLALVVFGVMYLSIMMFSVTFYIIFRTMNFHLSESQKLAREMARSRDLLQTTLDSSNIGIFGYDAKGELVLRQNTQEIFSHSLRHDQQSYFESDLKKYYEVDFKDNHDQAAEFASGSRHYIIFKRQAPSLLIYAVIDITERHRWQHQAIESEKLSLIGKMTSGIAHDYNNILAIALNNIEAFPVKQEPELWEDYIAPIQQSLEHARAISHKLLRLSTNRSQNLETLELSELLRDEAAIWNTALGEEIQLTIDKPSRVFVRSNREELSGAILNILLNARNAINQSGGKIRIKVKVFKEFCRISIIDNGPGIPDAIQDKIFDPFFTTKETKYSSGLGLFSVKTFLVQSGGRISFETHPGETAFHLWLPKGRSHRMSQSPISTTRKKETPSEKKLRKVLLIDDNEQVLQSMKRVFEMHGIEVITAQNAQRAMTSTMVNMDVDVAFIDYSMPDLNGLRLGQELMKIQPQIRYFMLTGNANNEILAQAQAKGFIEVLLKPVKIQKLIEIALFSLDDQKAQDKY